MLTDWSLKTERKKKIWSQEIKEKKTTTTPNKSSWTILLSAFWTWERRFFIHSQLPKRLLSTLLLFEQMVETFRKRHLGDRTYRNVFKKQANKHIYITLVASRFQLFSHRQFTKNTYIRIHVFAVFVLFCFVLFWLCFLYHGWVSEVTIFSFLLYHSLF